MHSKRIIQALVICGLSLTAFGCASTGESLVQSPQISLQSVQLKNISFRDQTFLLGFAVDNPNPFPLPVEKVRYRVQFDDQNFAGGESPAAFTIPANGRDRFQLTVNLDILGSANQITSLLRGGVPDHVSYQVDGSLTVDVPFARPLPFSSSGYIEIEH